MQTATIQYDFDCDEDTLWKASLFDEEYSRKLYSETLHFPRWRVLELKVTDDGLTRRVEIQPPIHNLPGPVKKMFGDQFAYVEEGTYDRKMHRYNYRMIPTVAQDRSRIVGCMYTRPRQPSGCTRMVDVEINVDIMIVGRLIEQKTIEDTRATHEKITAFTRAYLQTRTAPPAV